MNLLENLMFWKNRKIEKIKEVVTIKPKEEKKKKELFPCKECLVQPSCRDLCDKLERDNEKLFEIVKKYGSCPDCGSKEVYEGPSGGLCTNIYCCRCDHRFNISPITMERI